jgi:hypothetical protein
MTWPMMCYSYSFLIGWLLKKLVLRFGGLPAYQRATYLMIGVIAGDLLSALLFMAVGAIYYAVTGARPPGVYFFAV